MSKKTITRESLDYIAKLSDGSARQAISCLDKVLGCGEDEIDINTVLSSLGNYSYDTFFTLVNSLVDGDEATVLKIISDFYDEGNDLKLFVDQFLSFCLDVAKYSIFKSCDTTKIPTSMEDKLIYATNIENASGHFTYVVDRLLSLKNMLKSDSSPKSTIEIVFLQIARCK